MEDKDIVFVPCDRGIFYPLERQWHVGEYYNEGGRKGVVFTLFGPNHGMILSLKEGFEPFALDKDFEDGNPAKTKIGHTIDNDGSWNMFEVSRVAQWREKYPAFTWCDRLGKGWCLPSVREAQKFLLDDNVRNAVNETLKRVGGQPLQGRSRKLIQYWTSTESEVGKVGSNRPRAYTINLVLGGPASIPKRQKCKVRAVGFF